MKPSYGILSGLVGMALCLLALCIDLGSRISSDVHQMLNSLSASLGLSHLPMVAAGRMPLDAALRQMLLLIGAMLLFGAAWSKGKQGRLFQILEGALFVYGILSFIPLPTLPAYGLRFATSAVMFGLLWHNGLLKGTVNKIGAAGLECLGVGYLFGSHWWFFAGGILLTFYCAHWQYKEPGMLNAMWTALNGPFAAVAALTLILPASSPLSMSDKFQLCFGGLALGCLMPFILINEQRTDDRVRLNPQKFVCRQRYPGQPSMWVCACCGHPA